MPPRSTPMRPNPEPASTFGRAISAIAALGGVAMWAFMLWMVSTGYTR
jgi:hypothetical protein